jgi:hypothetical protein
MKLRTLFSITALFFIINAPIALLIPGRMLSLYGIAPGPGVNHMAQWAGLGSIMIALIAWIARNEPGSQIGRSITLALLIYFILGAAVSLYGTLAGIMSNIGWVLVIIYSIFTLSYSYSFLKNPDR